MTQVSGSISLELGKVVRETTKATLEALLTRTPPEGEATPLEQIGDAVADRIMVRLDRDLGGVLAEIRTGLTRIEELVRVNPASDQETLAVRGPDGTLIYQSPQGAEATSASTRADARLAEAQRNRVDDSWYEED